MNLLTTTQTFKLGPEELAALGRGFDVAKLTADGRESQWTVQQFKNLPLLDRVRLLAGGEIRFFRKGTEVPAREALRDL